jgi:hypothetical protein
MEVGRLETVDGGRWKVDGGRRKGEGGRCVDNECNEVGVGWALIGRR